MLLDTSGLRHFLDRRCSIGDVCIPYFAFNSNETELARLCPAAIKRPHSEVQQAPNRQMI